MTSKELLCGKTDKVLTKSEAVKEINWLPGSVCRCLTSRFVLQFAFLLALSGVYANGFAAKPSISKDVKNRLTLAFFHRPPYYENYPGKPPSGFLLEHTLKLFKEAAIPVHLKEVPPSRIMFDIEKNLLEICSTGWFRNAERVAFARFTEEIYQDRPLVVLTSRERHPVLRRFKSLPELLASPDLRFARIDSFSYGDEIDHWLKKYNTPSIGVNSKIDALPRLILLRRADYMLIAPEAYRTVLEEARVKESEFRILELENSPPGNRRYIICSRAVPQSVIQRLNRVIEKHHLESYQADKKTDVDSE